jgi:hypothetical protein
MQTFVPYANFNKTASVLDMKRLGKQRVETLQIMKALSDPSYGWQNHPAVKMWRGRRGALMMYQEAICNEWTSRGYKDTCLEKTKALVVDIPVSEWNIPYWLGDYALHESHRSNLTRKLPEWYSEFWDEQDDLPYVWPEEALV